MPPNDSQSTRLSLLLRVRDLGDAEAWRRFVDVYGPYVAKCCQGMGMQEADTADTTQAVLMKLMSVLQTWNLDSNKGSFRGWLKQVTKNVAIDLHRSWKERAAGDSAVMQSLLQVADHSFEESLWKSIETAYQQELLLIASQNVQLRVHPKTWMAYQLSCGENVSTSDIAQQLQMPIGDVYVARSRVLKMLRSEIQRLEEQDSQGSSG